MESGVVSMIEMLDFLVWTMFEMRQTKAARARQFFDHHAARTRQ